MEILSIAIATLVVLVLAHFAVYYVVRTLYPPAAPAPVPAPVAPPVVFTQPPVEQQQNVVIPTYETVVSVETTRQEGATPIGELQGPPVQRDTGLDAPHP